MSRNQLLGIALAAAVAATPLHGCKEKETYTIGTLEAWRFVHEYSAGMYYWNSNVPEYIAYGQYSTPEMMFETFRQPEDRFSAVYRNYTEIKEYLNANYVTDGMEVALYNYERNRLAAAVEYVYENSPAYQAGLRRGHVITKINNQNITTANYTELLDMPASSYTYSNIKSRKGKIVETDGEELSTDPVAKKEMELPPMQIVKTINHNGHKTGYILYNSFTESTRNIEDAISSLAGQNITELVLDLRLNGGGYASTLSKMVSMIMPQDLEGKPFILTTYNSLVSQELKKEEGENFNKTFFEKVPVHLGPLQRIYVLTSYSTASASEELISGLRPYIDVITIGEPTYGKFTTNILINDDEDPGRDPNGIPYSEWALYLSIGVCQNSKMEMDFINGFSPSIYAEDNYQHPLGHEEELLLSTALQHIAGGMSKSAQQPTSRNGRPVAHHGKPQIARAAMITKLGR